MGSGSSPGAQLGPSQSASLAQFERNQLKKLGLQEPAGFAQQSANEVFAYALNSDNPSRFAAFFNSLDPNKTIASRFGIRDDPEAIVEEPDPEPDKVDEDTDPASLFDDPVVQAQKRESSQASARAGRSSTVKTSPQGVTTEASTARPTLLASPNSRKLKTLLGQ